MKAIHPRTLWDDDAELSRLIRAAQRESPAALNALLARVRPSFVTYLASWLAADEAEDWAQCALLRVVQTFRRIDPDRVRPYLLAVARTMVREAHRRRARERGRLARAALADPAAAPITPDVAIERRELERVVRDTVAALSPKRRDALRGVLEGLSPSEIARRQRVNPATLRAHLRDARRVLRRRLRTYWSRLTGGPPPE